MGFTATCLKPVGLRDIGLPPMAGRDRVSHAGMAVHVASLAAASGRPRRVAAGCRGTLPDVTVVVVMWKRGVFMKWMMEGRGVDVDE